MSKKEYKIGDKYEIPEEGSLGLLALGYQGIMMWRCKKLNQEYAEQIVGPVLYQKELQVSVIGNEKESK
jgi:hypothetical protein